MLRWIASGNRDIDILSIEMDERESQRSVRFCHTISIKFTIKDLMGEIENIFLDLVLNRPKPTTGVPE